MLLSDLPEEVVGMIAENMPYASLVKWMRVCKSMNAHSWSTWRGQALLLQTRKWGTKDNFCAVFDTHVQSNIWRETMKTDPEARAAVIEAGVNIVLRYLEPRAEHVGAVTSAADRTTVAHERLDAFEERLERARFVMEHASELAYNHYMRWWHMDQRSGTTLRESECKHMTAMLSAVHMHLQVSVLIPRCGLTFKECLQRCNHGYWIPYNEPTRKYTGRTLFLGGMRHPEDDDIPETPEEMAARVAARDDPYAVHQSAMAVFSS